MTGSSSLPLTGGNGSQFVARSNLDLSLAELPLRHLIVLQRVDELAPAPRRLHPARHPAHMVLPPARTCRLERSGLWSRRGRQGARQGPRDVRRSADARGAACNAPFCRPGVSSPTEKLTWPNLTGSVPENRITDARIRPRPLALAPLRDALQPALIPRRTLPDALRLRGLGPARRARAAQCDRPLNRRRDHQAHA